MNDITKIKVDGEPESSYKLFPKNREFEKRAGGNTGSQSGVQPDWNQNDETQPDYVKNRPFYEDVAETVLVEESILSFTTPEGSFYYAAIPTTIELTAGETYKVSWDGATYECVCEFIRGSFVIGNPSIIGIGADTGDPFVISPLANDNGTEFYTKDASASHTISISVFAGELVKIDAKYLPMSTDDSYGVVKKSDIVSAYNFPKNAPHDQMVEAIIASTTGRSKIVWGGLDVISAYYDSSTDEINVQFAGSPFRFITFKNLDGFYKKDIVKSSEYIELTGKQARIFNSEGAYIVLATEGVPSDTTLHASANKFSINGDIKGYALVLHSSTNNSKKWFRITVDDSGTISATEVT